MEGRGSNRDTSELDGFEDGIRVESPCSAHVDLDLDQPSCRRLSRELVGDGPARVPADDPELLLIIEAVDLDDHSVNLIIKRVAFILPATTVIHDLVK